ncbi:LOW QUALITY PROTEIN: RING finger protein 207 [Aplochiton taeniatus]
MAGGGLAPLENQWDIDCTSVHPLVCPLCHEPYQRPCLLDCYHILCARCLHGRALDSRLNFPLCGSPSVVKGVGALPPEDRPLRFLVDDSSDTEKSANCDREGDQQNTGGMCNQSRCGACQESTHGARMFARHDAVSLAKRNKASHRKCSLHEEPYIMLSTEKKSMLCIKCFRDMQVVSWTHCLDIETAYMQGCEILDQTVMAVIELHTSVREAIVLLKAVIAEVGLIMEESAICTLFHSMQLRHGHRPRERLGKRKKMKATQELRLSVKFKASERDNAALKEQRSHRAALLPTFQVHLVTCSAFLSSASKHEFLDMGIHLMERLRQIVKLPLRPVQSSKINTEYRNEFARSLETLLVLGQRRPPTVVGTSAVSTRLQSPPSMAYRSPSFSEMPLGTAMGQRPTTHRYICTKVLLAEGGETPFTEHCRDYENSYRTLHSEIQYLKDQLQEMHRDLTKHHSVINTHTMGEILERSLHIDGQIASQYSAVETSRAMFAEIWDETFQKVAIEQEIYEAQLHDLLQLKQENSYLTTIARQIGPYILSIAKVMERLEPRFQEPTENHDDRTETMLKIYEDSAIAADKTNSDGKTLTPDNNWDKNSDNRCLILPTDDASLKTKDCHSPGSQKAIPRGVVIGSELLDKQFSGDSANS